MPREGGGRGKGVGEGGGGGMKTWVSRPKKRKRTSGKVSSRLGLGALEEE